MNELKEKLKALLAKAAAIAEAAEKDGDRDFTAEERQQVVAIMDEAKAVKKQIQEKASDDEIRKSIAELGVDLAPKPEKGALVLPGQGASAGERFIESPEYKRWLAQFPNGRVPDSAKGLISPPVAFKGLADMFGQKTLITGVSDTSGGAMVVNDNLDLLVPGLRRPLTIRDVVTNGGTESDTVEYVRVTTETNNAAPVAEATATSGGSGAKPESAMLLEKVTETVNTIAHWIPATKRALSDARQLRTLIDQFLRFGLEEELEDQMINGDGTGENFTGISNVTNVQAQAWDTNILVTTRKARTKVRTVGRDTPNAYLLHPTDWETIQLIRDESGGAGTGSFLFGGPAGNQAQTLWGLPVVESEALTQGVGYVGNFRQAVLWDREQATIQVSDSHSDFFIRNMVAILAELRAAFGVLRPKSIVEIDLTA